MAADYKINFKGDDQGLKKSLKDLEQAFKLSQKELRNTQKEFANAKKEMTSLNSENDKLKSKFESLSSVMNKLSKIDVFKNIIKAASVEGVINAAVSAFKKIAMSALEGGRGIETFNQTITAAKSTFGTFANALSSGNFQVLRNNIFSANMALQEQISIVKNLTGALNYLQNASNIKITIAERIINNPNTSAADKVNALADAKREAEKTIKSSKENAEAINEKVILSGKAKGIDATYEQMQDILINANKYDRINNEIDTRYNKPSGFHGTQRPRAAIESDLVQEGKYSREEIEAAKKINKFNNKEREELLKQITEYDNLKAAEGNINARLDSLENKPTSNSSGGGGGGSDTDSPRSYSSGSTSKAPEYVYQENSIGYYKKLLSEANEDLLRATTDESRQVINGIIDEITLKLDQLENRNSFKEGSISDLENKISKLKKKQSDENDKEKRLEYQKEIDTLQKQRSDIEKELKPVEIELAIKEGSLLDLENKINELKKELSNETDLKIMLDIQSNINTLQKQHDDIQNSLTPVDYINELMNAYSNLGKAMSEIGNSGLLMDTTFGKIISTMGSMISVVPDVVEAIKLIKAANQAQASSAAQAAIAETAKNTSAMGPLGWIISIGAIATLATALMSTMGKFATGGIVGGSSYSGDQVLARVNSGEMILNSGQQNRLFSMLNSGMSTNNVQFVLRGNDLIGLINNTQRKRNI